MAKIRIHEGASGILNLQGSDEEIFVPDYDLDKACQLLFRFYELTDDRGVAFKDNYVQGGFNWLSCALNFLFARLIYRFVQYGDFLALLEKEGIAPSFANKGNFYRLYDHFRPPKRSFKPADAWAYRRTLPAHNRRLAETVHPDLLFYRYGPNDFRTREMLAHFMEREVNFAFVYSPSRKLIKRRAGYERPVYLLHAKQPRQNLFNRNYDYSGFSGIENRFARLAVAKVEEYISAAMAEYEAHLKNLSIMRPKAFFALEDLNRLHPLIFACKKLGIPAIGYQTGTYSSRQSANVLHKWGPGEFDYFDRMIIWGKYWEEVTRKNSEAFGPDFFIVGANKHTYSYRRLDSTEFNVKNVLVPFEYLANTYAVGRYMKKLMDLGYTVHFKLKPDWDLERQISCYHLGEYRERLKLAPDISDEFMATINIVAGTMTTLLFDLLPYGKETWVLETEYRLLDDMIEAGYARKMGMAELESTTPAKADKQADYGYIFNPGSITEVLDTNVLSLLGG